MCQYQARAMLHCMLKCCNIICMRGGRLLGLAAAIAAALLVLAHTHFSSLQQGGVVRQARKTFENEPKPQPSQQIGGTVSMQSLAVDANREASQTVATPSSLPERTLQCPTYAGPMYFVRHY